MRHGLPPGDPRHGTGTGYTYWRCRCGICQEWNCVKQAEYRARRKPPPPGDPRHGQFSTYTNWNCRCESCRAAGLAHDRQWNAAHPGTTAARVRRWRQQQKKAMGQ